MEYATRGRFGGLDLKTIGRTVFGFRPQNPGGGSEEERGGTWRNHRGCIEAKLSYEGRVAVECFYLELDHNTCGSSGSAQNI